MKVGYTLLSTAILVFFAITNSYSQEQPKCGFDPIHQQKMAEDPDYKAYVEGYLKALPKISGETKEKAMMETIRIPVVVHVIHNGEPIGTGQNISLAQIEAQIQILNDDFSAMNAGYDSAPERWENIIGNPNMQFCLASIDPDGNPTDGVTRDQFNVTEDGNGDTNIESEIKPAVAWDPHLYYNIYTLPIPGTTSGGGTTGYAYLPYNGTVGNPGTDGSVVDYRWFGGPGFSNSGSGTLTHETGHYLGLFHPFNGESCSADDGIADTPNVDAPTSDYMNFINCSNSWPTGPMSCGNEHMYIQFMDYTSPDGCSIAFSQGQVNVMRAVMDGTSSDWASREALANNVLAVCSFFDYEAGVNEIIAPAGVTCYSDDITPMITITNFGLQTINNLTINYQINGNPPVVMNWVDNLISGASITLDLAPFTPPNVDYTFTTWVANPNGQIDEYSPNDTSSVLIDRIVPLPLPYGEGFEGNDWDPTVNGTYLENFGNDAYEWEHNTSIGAYGNSNQCAWFDNFNAIGGQNTVDGLFTPIMAVTDINELQIKFDYAYTYFDNGFKDSLAVLASTDCGDNYDIILFAKGGADLATKAPQSQPFTPQPEHWVTENLDISGLGNPENLSLAFVNASGYGNNLYIDNIVITESCILNASALATDIVCNGDCDATVTVNVEGAAGNLTYAYDNGIGAVGPTVNNLCAGEYTVEVTDESGCSSVLPFTINEPPPMVVTPTVTQVTGVNTNDGVIQLTTTGGTPFYFINWPAPIPDGSPIIGGLSPGVYDIEVIDAAGCISPISIEILPFDCSDLQMEVTGSDALCAGEVNGSINVNVTSGAEPFGIQWDQAIAGFNPSAVSAGLYQFTVTDGIFCSVTGAYEVGEPEDLIVNITGNNLSAPGANDGSATAAGSGGTPEYTYDWGAQGTGPTISNLAPGIYTVTMTDAQDCATVSSVEILDVDCSLFSATISGSDVTCFGFGDGVVEIVAEGTGTLTYEWSISPANVAMLTNVAPGNIVATVSDDLGCSQQVFIAINEPAPLELALNIDADVQCAGDNAAALSAISNGGNGGNTYIWNTSETAESINGLVAGYYCLTITDDQGCTIAAEWTFDDPEPITATSTLTHLSIPGANDGSIVLAGQGGTGELTYTWDNSMSGATINGLAPGEYIVTITDENDCFFTETYTILDAIVDCTSFAATLVVTDLSCINENDGTGTVTVSGGQNPYSFTWSNEAVGASVVGLQPGPVSVTVEDEFGCQIILSDFISEPTALTGTAVSTTTSGPGMSDGSVTALGINGTPPYSYNWDIPATGETVNNLPAGTYAVVITDANFCNYTTTVEVLDGNPDCSAFSATMTINDLVCWENNDGNATVEALGGAEPYTYNWSAGIASENITTGLPAGVVSVTISDVFGCEVIANGVVEQPEQLIVMGNTFPTSGPGQSDGTLSATATGGVGDYTFEWSVPAMGATIENVPAGFYTVTATDANGCSAEIIVELEEGDVDCSNYEVALTIENISCSGLNDGTATAVASGELGNTLYTWTVPGDQSSVSNLWPGMVSVTIEDETTGCLSTASGTVIEPEPLILTYTSTPTSGPGMNDGSATASALGGTAGYIFNWDIPATGPNVDNLAAGSYQVTVIDANGCESTITVVIDEGDADCSQFAVELVIEDVSCNGFADGSVSANVSGEMGTISYTWSVPGNQSMVSNLSAGMVSVTIEDSETGCISNASAMVAEPAALAISASATPSSGPGQSDGSVSATAFGGTPTYTYSWDIPATGPNVGNLMAGIYEVTVTDSNGCEFVSTVVVGEGEADCSNFSAEIFTSLSSCQELGAAVVTSTGGIENYIYNWSQAGLGNSSSVNGLNPGPFSVTVLDAVGCEVIIDDEIESVELISIDNETVLNTTGPGNNDGSISIIASGGQGTLQYVWSNSMTGSSIMGLAPGTYTVTITDLGDCQEIETYVIEEGEGCALQLMTTTTMATCWGFADGTATVEILNGNGEYNIQWSNNLGNALSITTEAGSYSVLITDGNGCVGETSVTIGEPAELDLMVIGVDGSCGTQASATASVNGGTNPYNYQWSNNENTETISGLNPGDYQVTITDGNGCATDGSVSVNIDNNTLDVDYEIVNVNCAADANGSIELDIIIGTPPYNIVWSDGTSGNTLENLSAGQYSVLVNDAAGCNFFSQFEVQSPAPLTASLFVQAPSSGNNDGSIQATINGGTPPYQVSWSTGASGIVLEDVGLGSYTATVTDDNGCTYQEVVNVTTTDVNQIDGLQAWKFNPNPTTGWLNMELELLDQQSMELSLFNLAGIQILKETYQSQKVSEEIDLSALPQGVYWMVLTNEQGARAWKKLVKVNN